MATAVTKPTIAVDLDEVLGAFVEGLAVFHNERYGTKLTSADFRSYHFADVWGGTGDEATAKVLAFYESDHFRELAPIAAAAECLSTLSAHFRFVVVTSRQHMIADKTRSWLGRHFPGIFADVVFGNHYDAGDGAVSRCGVWSCRALCRVVVIRGGVSMGVEQYHLHVPPQPLSGTPERSHLRHRIALSCGLFRCTPNFPTPPLHSNSPLFRGRSKSDMCRDVGAIALIDDNMKYALEVAPHLPLVILFGAYPWNTPTAPTAAPAPATGSTATATATATGGSGPATTSGTETAKPAGGGVGTSTPPRLPMNVVRAVNWRHVYALLMRIRVRNDPAATKHRGGREPPSLAFLCQTLHHRDFFTVFQRPGNVATPEGVSEQLRRILEAQETIAVTGVGYECRLVAEAADLLSSCGDATVVALRTGADGAPDGKPRLPRLTITLTRTPRFLSVRFALPTHGMVRHGGGDGDGGEMGATVQPQPQPHAAIPAITAPDVHAATVAGPGVGDAMLSPAVLQDAAAALGQSPHHSGGVDEDGDGAEETEGVDGVHYSEHEGDGGLDGSADVARGYDTHLDAGEYDGGDAGDGREGAEVVEGGYGVRDGVELAIGDVSNVGGEVGVPPAGGEE